MERHSNGVLRPLFSRLLCVPASSAAVASLLPKWSNRQTKPSIMSNSLLETWKALCFSIQLNSIYFIFYFLTCNLVLWTVSLMNRKFWLYCSCHDSFICCSVLLAFFSYIIKICHIITTVVNTPIPVHLSASASMVRPRPRTLWPRRWPRRLGLGLGLVMSGLVNIPDSMTKKQNYQEFLSVSNT